MGNFSEFYSMNVDSTESKTHDMLKMSIVNAAQQNLVVCFTRLKWTTYIYLIEELFECFCRKAAILFIFSLFSSLLVELFTLPGPSGHNACADMIFVTSITSSACVKLSVLG